MKTYKNFPRQIGIITLQFAFIIIVLLSSNLFSQNALKRSIYSLGGSIAYSNSKSTISNVVSDYTLKTNEIFIAPSFGYFIIDNLLIGANVSFIYSETKSESSYRSPLPGLDILSITTIRKQFGIGPNIRYYFSGLSIIPFVEGGYSYSKEFTSEQEGNIFSIAAGINYFLSNSVALEPFLSYSITTYKNPDSDINRFSIGVRTNYFIVD